MSPLALLFIHSSRAADISPPLSLNSLGHVTVSGDQFVLGFNRFFYARLLVNVLLGPEQI